MKVIFWFLGGILFSGILMVGVSFGLPAFAQTDDLTTTDNMTLADLLPDIEKIYRDALLFPFMEVEDKIYDEEISQYYRTLLEKSGMYETTPGITPTN